MPLVPPLVIVGGSTMAEGLKLACSWVSSKQLEGLQETAAGLACMRLVVEVGSGGMGSTGIAAVVEAGGARNGQKLGWHHASEAGHTEITLHAPYAHHRFNCLCSAICPGAG